MVGDALRMITRACSNDAGLSLGLRKLENLVERAAFLETPGHLQVFKLEESAAAAQSAECER